MANNSLDDIYDVAYKASASVSGFNAGNKSLTSLCQNMPPFSSSAIPSAAIANLLIKYNNGNMSGQDAPGAAVTSVNNTNISLGTLSSFSGSFANNYTFGATYNFPTMFFKYVPEGSSDDKIDLYREATQKVVDTTNFQSVNSSANPEQSGSFGLPWKKGSGTFPTPDFAGTLTCGGVSNNYWHISSSCENGDPIPPGSGSYMIPNGADGEDTVFIAFWILPAEGQEVTKTVWCSNNQSGGNRDWDPYAGIQFQLTSTGNLIISKGDCTGTTSRNRTTFQTNWQLSFGVWNLVCIRVTSAGSNVATSTNYAWGYIPDRAGTYGWNGAGLSYLNGTGGNICFRGDRELVVNPGDGEEYFTGQIGHFYFFAEKGNTQVTDSQRFQLQYSTNSGSHELYTS
tara:strand:- start:2430 stop:3623 length:1194 start_codon:yes stop_codon:yes gene_type:complete